MGQHSVSSVGTAEYDALIEVVKRARERAGRSQRDLSLRLGHDGTYIDKVERRGRRLDVAEFGKIAVALGLDPRDLFAEYADEAFPRPQKNSYFKPGLEGG